jgi:hypothetical protein
VSWLFASDDYVCQRCLVPIPIGDDVAWLRGSDELLCKACGCDAQDKADEGIPVDDSSLPACEREDGAA